MRRLLSVCALALLFAGAMFAQNSSGQPFVELVYADDLSRLTVTAPDGTRLPPAFGMKIMSGSVLVTSGSAAELKLQPNGSIVRLAPSTTFKVEGLASVQGDKVNAFRLVSGKIRMVAAKTLSDEASYQLRTPTAVGGVRGTDFAMQVQEGKKDWLYVREGLVEFRKVGDGTSVASGQPTGQAILVKAGEYADTYSPVFRSVPVPADGFQSVMQDMNFIKADPSAVPSGSASAPAPAAEAPAVPAAAAPAVSQPAPVPAAAVAPPAPAAAPSAVAAAPAPAPATVAPAATPAESAKAAPAAVDKTSKAPASEAGSPATAVPAPPAAPAAPVQEEGAPADGGAGSSGGFALGDILTFEVGSITIAGNTYAKAILQPKIDTGKLRFALYLPVIYQSDILNPHDWYQPEGNNEWSFGSDQEGTAAIARDAASDLALKIRYFEFGNQGSDPFFVKFGNLETLTLGHGSLVRNYSNNQEFPAVRKLGFSIGFRAGAFSLETIADDLADIRVAGARVGLGNGMFGIGFTGVADIDAASDWNRDPLENPRHDYGKPAVIGAGVDLQLFSFNLGVLSATAYSDAGVFFPVFRNSPIVAAGAEAVPTGFDAERVFEYSKNNWLATAGVSGKVLLIVDYCLEFRLSRGLARPSLIDANWNRNRTPYVESVVSYLEGTTRDAVNDTISMGLYGSAGSNILGVLLLNGGYFWPWTLNGDGSVDFGSDDKLDISLTIPKGKIPFISLSGSVLYSRRQFAHTLADAINDKNPDGVNLFDANTVFGGEIVYGLVKGMDLAVQIFTATVTDKEGNVMYERGQPMIRPVVNIETRVSF